MKSINDQLYGYSYELDRTTEEDLTTCNALDTGTVFVAYGGVWYEQPVYWADPGSGGGGGGGGGGGAGGLIVNVTKQQDDTRICDKTAGEIMAVVEVGGSVVFKTENDGDYMYKPLEVAAIMSGTYQFSASLTYTADSADDYPITGGIQ